MASAPVELPDGPVQLRVRTNNEAVQFSYSIGGSWRDVGPVLDGTLLSDEAGKGEGANFTGAFVALCAQDLSGRALAADFTYLKYRTGAFLPAEDG